MRRRLARAGDGSAGTTLPELLITMVLTSIVAVMVVSFVANYSQTFTKDRSASDSTVVAGTGMSELTRVIRSGTQLAIPGNAAAPVFVVANANDMTLYAYIDTDATAAKPVKVQFSIDAQRRLIERRWAATTTTSPWTFAASPYSTRTVARAIPAGSAALFTYLDASSTAMVIPGAGFTDPVKRTIAAVRVSLRVQADVTGRAEPVTIQNAVGIPNLGISRVRP